MRKTFVVLCFAVLALITTASAQRVDIAFGMGSVVSPELETGDTEHSIQKVGGGTYPAFSVDYLMWKNLGVNGQVAWRARDFPKGSLVYADERLYLYSERGDVALAEASSAGYREHGRFQLQTGSLPTWSHPVVSGGKLFLRDQDVIYAYDVAAR